MTTDFVPCGKCGRPTPAPQFYVPPVTWHGRVVCGDCTNELLRSVNQYKPQPIQT